MLRVVCKRCSRHLGYAGRLSAAVEDIWCESCYLDNRSEALKREVEGEVDKELFNTEEPLKGKPSAWVKQPEPQQAIGPDEVPPHPHEIPPTEPGLGPLLANVRLALYEVCKAIAYLERGLK